MNKTARHCPLARLHHGLPKLLLWAMLALVAAVGAVTTIGSTIGTASAHAATVTDTPGLVSVRLDADEVQRAVADATFREGVCLSDMHLAGQPCAESLLACIAPNAPLHVPLLVTLDYTGNLRECLRNP